MKLDNEREIRQIRHSNIQRRQASGHCKQTSHRITRSLRNERATTQDIKFQHKRVANID